MVVRLDISFASTRLVEFVNLASIRNRGNTWDPVLEPEYAWGSNVSCGLGFFVCVWFVGTLFSSEAGGFVGNLVGRFCGARVGGAVGAEVDGFKVGVSVGADVVGFSVGGLLGVVGFSVAGLLGVVGFSVGGLLGTWVGGGVGGFGNTRLKVIR